MRVHRTPTRHNIDMPGRPMRRVTLVEVRRPGLSGLWNYHVTKGWRRVPSGAMAKAVQMILNGVK